MPNGAAMPPPPWLAPVRDGRFSDDAIGSANTWYDGLSLSVGPKRDGESGDHQAPSALRFLQGWVL